MPPRIPRRALAGAGTAVTLALTGSLVAGGSPASSAPAADCAVPFPIADLTAGDAVHGLTVTSGTVPEEFGGEVLGVLDDGVAPGVDMVMVRVDPTGLDIDPTEVKGIWQGMSGSPVYAEDGRLVGAVAYGLASFEQSWVAGITPFEDMDDYLGADLKAAPVRLDARTAARVASAAGISPADAAQGFAPLPVPLAVSGAAARFLNPTAEEVAAHPWLRTGTIAAGRAGGALDADSIVAGGNVAGAMAYGDVTMAGIGTATSVCDGDVVGFGHPLGFFGDTTLSLHPADVLYVQGSMPSFKVANLGNPVGTIFGDHTTGITGRFGAVPDTATISSAATWGTRSRSGATHLTVRSPDDMAFLTYLQTAMNTSRVIDGAVPGSEVYSWTISGSDANGEAFSLTWTDRVRSSYDIADEMGMTAAGWVETFAYMPGVTIDSIAVSGTATSSSAHFSLARVEQKRSGTWQRVTDRRPAVARAGSTLAVRAVFTGAGGELTIPFEFAVPRNAKGKVAMLAVVGGQSTYLRAGDTIEEAAEGLADGVRSDVVRAQFGRPTSDDVSYYDDYEDEGPFIIYKGGTHGPRPVSFVKTQLSEPGDAVMAGFRMVPVLIR